MPPAPGDEGVAVGCALFGLHKLRIEASAEARAENPPALPRSFFPAYQGGEFSFEEIDDAIGEMMPWLLVEELDTEEEVIERAVEELTKESGEGNTGDKAEGVIAWFNGRSEFGQRALGSRSFLADPRREHLRRYLNEEVKEREW